MTTRPDQDKAFLQLCLDKRLIDKQLAKAVWQESRQTGIQAHDVLVARGLMANHTVQALQRELEQLQEPQIIGGFRILSTLGKGGMATVYLAEQISLGRQVALKLMSPHIAADQTSVDRFLREARTAAAINHPNVISIFDVGHSNGHLFMALELVTGGDANQLAARFGGALPESRALELLIDCAKGLQALYEARLVHRDLKPSNIFITTDGSGKLGDLGLARNEDGADRLTMTGHLVGTPAFMSPEQASGDAAIDIRSDIYSLGATLFALLTGRQPFVGNTPISVAAKALTEPIPDPRLLAPQISPTTAALVMKTMAKSPNERFQSPKEFTTALLEAVTQVPVKERHPSIAPSHVPTRTDSQTPITIPGTRRRTPSGTRPSRHQHSLSLIASSVVLTAVLIGSWGFLRQASAASPSKPPTALSAPDVTTKPDAATKSNADQSKSPAQSERPSTVTISSPAATTSPSTVSSSPVTTASLSHPDAKPPVGPDPPRVPWASAQGRDEFGFWITLTINGSSQRLRWLPPGSARIGSPEGEPGHMDSEALSTVIFTYGSWLADSECTQEFWQAVSGRNPSKVKEAHLPVTDITVAEAIIFSRLLSPFAGHARTRLPSRAEWERACRAGTSTQFATGDDPESMNGYANLNDRDRRTAKHQRAVVEFSDGFIGLAPVCSFKPNRWGFFDLHGNVAEFCLATADPLPATCRDPATDDNPNAQVGFIRGGNYGLDSALNARCAALPYIGQGSANEDTGFRFLIEPPH